MPAYRLYCIDGVGGFERAHWIAADDDDQALSYALAKYASEQSCELWDGGRLVAHIPQIVRAEPQRRGGE